MQNQGVGTWPHRASRQAPDATAIVFRDQRMSYRELDDRVTRLAHALADLGVHRGDRVALPAPIIPSTSRRSSLPGYSAPSSCHSTHASPRPR